MDKQQGKYKAVQVPTSGAREYRVSFRREGWAKTKWRLYQQRHYAERFAQRLIDGEDEFGLLQFVRIDSRSVQPWVNGQDLVIDD